MRIEGWERRLFAAIKEAEGQTFAWGSFDCCLFAAAAIEAVTGIDHAARFRGRYRSRAGADRVLLDFAGGGLVEAVRRLAAKNGWIEVVPALARRGDLGLTSSDEGSALAVCVGPWFVMAAKAGGTCAVPTSRVSLAWRIG